MGIPNRLRESFWTRFCARTSRIDSNYSGLKPAKTGALKMGLVPLPRVALWFKIRSSKAMVVLSAENSNRIFNQQVMNHIEGHWNSLKNAVGDTPEIVVPESKQGTQRIEFELNHDGTDDSETWDKVIDDMVDLMEKVRTVIPSIFDDFDN